MKKAILLLTVGLIITALFTGCDKRNGLSVPTDPLNVSDKDADRVLTFQYDNNKSKTDQYFIALYNTDSKSKAVNDDIVVLTLGDSVIALVYHNYPPDASGWFSDGSHQISGTKNIKLKINNKIILNTNITAINTASAAFPANYDYQQPLTLNWAVDSTNEYQFVRAESWDNEVVGSYSPLSEYVKKIPTNQARFTFPANCVSISAGGLSQTSFILFVEEVNYKIIKKTAVMVYQEESWGYYDFRSSHKTMGKAKRVLDINRFFTR